MTGRNLAGVALQILLAPLVIGALGYGHGLAVCAAALFLLSSPREVLRTPVLLLFPLYVAGLLAPALAGVLLARHAGGPELWAGFPFSLLGLRVSLGYTVVSALCGAAVGLWAFGWQGAWKRHAWMQALNLPTSAVRAAAAGQIELQGVARRLDGAATGAILSFTTGASLREFTQHLEPFYLEDATGRILVDPRGATARGGGDSNVEALLFEVRLTRGALHPGDPVYVVGHAQRRDDAPPAAAGPEALVVKPLEEPAAGLFSRFIRGALRREFQHAFFLTDAAEDEARRRAREGAIRSWILGIVYLGAAGAVLAVEAPRFLHGPARWTVEEIHAGTRGTERVQALASRIDDPDPAVRAKALARLADAVRDDKAVAIDAEILRALDDPGGDVRDAAFEALQAVGLRGPAPDVSRALAGLLQNPAPRVRRWALERLSAAHAPEAGAALPGLLDDPDPEVRAAAVEALAAHPARAREALPGLLARLDEAPERWAVRRTLRGLDYDPAFAVAEFLKHRRHASPRVRSLALEVLGRYKDADPAVVPALREALLDEDPWMRWTAQDALGLNAVAGRFDADRLPVLVSLLSEPDLSLLQAAVRSLEGFGAAASAAVPALIPLLRRPEVVAGGRAGDVSLPDVLSALGRIGDPSAEEAILACLKDERPEIRIAASRAAASLRSSSREGLAARVRALDEERTYAAQEAMAQALLREASAGSLAAVGDWLGRGQGHEGIRLETTRALGRLGARAAPALGGLERLAARDTRELRAAAEDAIRRIRGPGR